MDNLTHSLVGALLGQAGLKNKTGLAMPALIIGANLPDVDAACFFWLEGQEHLGFRRGITHGPPAMVLLPLVLASLLYGYDRWQAKRGKRPEGQLPVSFKWLYLLSLIGCLTHPALDWLNVYGIRLLEPFSSRWFYGDTLFIIDVWLWVLMGFATWFSLRREKKGGEWKKPARVAVAVSLAYIGLNGAITWQAEDAYAEHHHHAIASPVPIAFWDRELILPNDGLQAQAPPRIISKDILGGVFTATPSPNSQEYCRLISLPEKLDPEIEAWIFWSRVPFAERSDDGRVYLNDARFYHPQAQGRFTIELPGAECVPLDQEPTAD